MHKISDDAFEFKGTRFHLRAFTDPLNIEKPVFVLEEGVGNQHSLESNRVALARELAGSIYRNPEEITWLEQARDGSLRQFDFEYTHTDTIYPNQGSLSPDELQAVDKGEMNSEKIARYNTREREGEVSLLDFRAQVGDALEPYEKRQQQEFFRMETQIDKTAFQQEREAELAHNPLHDYAPDL